MYLHRRVLWPSIFLIFIVWMNWRTLQPTIFSVGVLKSRTGIRATVGHVLGSRASERGTVTTEQGQLGIGVRVQLYVGKVLGIPLLVTACCDNSGVSGVVTWKSPDGVFAIRFFSFINKSPCHLFSTAYLVYWCFICATTHLHYKLIN